jgi:hypothetical protein
MAGTNNSINNTVAQGNFSVNQNTSGTPVVCTVSQTDSTNTNSNANFIISTGGTAAGNPFITYKLTGSTSWTTGIDQTASQQYKVSQGTIVATNTAVQIDTSGRINYPLQSAFSAFVSTTGNVLNITGDGTAFTIIFDTVSFDQASNYNSSTGIFTAPINGIYYFIGSVLISTIATGCNIGYLDIRTSGATSQIFRLCKLNPFNAAVQTGGGAPSEVLQGGVYIQLVKNDTVKVVITTAGSTKTTGLQGVASGNIATYFQGYLAQ